MEAILNYSERHPFSKVGDNNNYDWNRRILSVSSDFSALTALAIIIGVLSIIVKNVITTKKEKQSNKIVDKSSIVKVPWHTFLKYMWQHSNDFPRVVVSLNQSYGSAWRFGFLGKNFVFVNNAEILQKLLSSGHSGHLKKPSFMYNVAFQPQVREGLASSSVSTWKVHRNVLNKAFTYESLRYHLTIFDEHAKKLVMTINDTLTETENADHHEKSLHNLIHVSSFGMILQIVTGRNILSAHDTALTHKLFDRCKEIISYRLYRPWLIMSEWLWNLHPLKKELESHSSALETINRQIMAKTRELMKSTENVDVDNDGKIGRKSLVEIMIRGELSDEEICSEVGTFLLLGHETVSMSTNILMFNLAVHPEYQKKCHEEVDQLFTKLESNNEELSLESLNELKYLEKCIKENLRMYPTAPGIGRELDSPLVIDENTTLEPGLIVLFSPYFLHRSSAYYQNPTEFIPERFSVENCQNRGLYEYIPFSQGGRNCIGWKMAMLELKVLAAYLLRNFEAHTTNPKNYLVNQFEKCIWPCADIGVRLRRRR